MWIIGVCHDRSLERPHVLCLATEVLSNLKWDKVSLLKKEKNEMKKKKKNLAHFSNLIVPL